MAQRCPAAGIAPFDAEQANAHQHAWADYLGVPVEHTNTIGMTFILIPPGEFTMGSSPAEIRANLTMIRPLGPGVNHWLEFFGSEGPQHKVILTQLFYPGVHGVHGVHGVTRPIFSKSWVRLPPSGAVTDAVAENDTANHPVVMVSWNDAAEFCARLCEQEELKPFYLCAGETITAIDGTGYRLPSEAEWEFACRAGTTTRFWSGAQDEDLLQAGWFLSNSGGRTHAVAELLASPFGLFDMHGNAWEWVQDGWSPTGYGQIRDPLAINPGFPFPPVRSVWSEAAIPTISRSSAVPRFAPLTNRSIDINTLAFVCRYQSTPCGRGRSSAIATLSIERKPTSA